MRLSYSGCNTYNECPKKYKYKYIDKIQEKTKSSALHFGASLDLALNRLLLSKKKILTEEERLIFSKTPHEIFLEEFDKVSLPIEFNYSDIDPSLFSDEKETEELLNHWKLFKIKDDEFDSYARESLINKAKLFIEAYNNEVIPQILEVYKVQTKIELPNDTGDIYVGALDFTAKFNDNKVYVCDNKTTSTVYTDTSASESVQLTPYAEAEQINDVMFVTIDKKIRKKVPKVRIKLIRGHITEDKKQEVFDSLGNTLYNIKSEVFDKKEDRSKCFSYGKKCPYFELCWNKGE